MKKQHSTDSVLQAVKRENQLENAFERDNSVSFTDCTGAVPRAPETKEQLKNYEDTYHFRQVSEIRK